NPQIVLLLFKRKPTHLASRVDSHVCTSPRCISLFASATDLGNEHFHRVYSLPTTNASSLLVVVKNGGRVERTAETNSHPALTRCFAIFGVSVADFINSSPAAK